MLAVASIAASYRLSKPIANAQARKTWLPFAEIACTNLTTIGLMAERMRRMQRGDCGRMMESLDASARDRCKSLFPVLDTQCRESAEKLASIRDQIRSAQNTWETFIRQNCDGVECEEIDQRLREVERDMRQRMDMEAPLPSCEQDNGNRNGSHNRDDSQSDATM